jgi:hypothetical protein
MAPETYHERCLQAIHLKFFPAVCLTPATAKRDHMMPTATRAPACQQRSLLLAPSAWRRSTGVTSPSPVRRLTSAAQPPETSQAVPWKVSGKRRHAMLAPRLCHRYCGTMSTPSARNTEFARSRPTSVAPMVEILGEKGLVHEVAPPVPDAAACSPHQSSRRNPTHDPCRQ